MAEMSRRETIERSHKALADFAAMSFEEKLRVLMAHGVVNEKGEVVYGRDIKDPVDTTPFTQACRDVRVVELHAAKAGLEIVAKNLEARAKHYLESGHCWGWRTIAEELQRAANAIRAMDPVSIVPQEECTQDEMAKLRKEMEDTYPWIGESS